MTPTLTTGLVAYVLWSGGNSANNIGVDLRPCGGARINIAAALDRSGSKDFALRWATREALNAGSHQRGDPPVAFDDLRGSGRWAAFDRGGWYAVARDLLAGAATSRLASQKSLPSCRKYVGKQINTSLTDLPVTSSRSIGAKASIGTSSALSGR